MARDAYIFQDEETVKNQEMPKSAESEFSNEKQLLRVSEPKFSMTEAAKAIGVCRAYIGKLMDKGKLGYYQIGRRRIVSASQLEQYLSKAERKATTNEIHRELSPRGK